MSKQSEMVAVSFSGPMIEEPVVYWVKANIDGRKRWHILLAFEDVVFWAEFGLTEELTIGEYQKENPQYEFFGPIATPDQLRAAA